MSARSSDWWPRRVGDFPAPGNGRLLRVHASGLGALRLGPPHPPAPRYTPPPPDAHYRPPRLEPANDMDKDELRAMCATLTVIVDIDDSGSMHVDSAGVRNAAAKAIERFLRDQGGGRLGVVHWTHRVEAELAPVDIRTGRRALEGALEVRTACGGNNVALAIRRTKQLLPRLSSNEHQAAVFLTDGQEFGYRNHDPSDHVADVHDALVALQPASVHVVLIDHSGYCTPEEEDIWRGLPIASFTRLDLRDPAQLCWTVAQTLLGPYGIRLSAPRSASLRRGLFR